MAICADYGQVRHNKTNKKLCPSQKELKGHNVGNEHEFGAVGKPIEDKRRRMILVV